MFQSILKAFQMRASAKQLLALCYYQNPNDIAGYCSSMSMYRRSAALHHKSKAVRVVSNIISIIRCMAFFKMYNSYPFKLNRKSVSTNHSNNYIYKKDKLRNINVIISCYVIQSLNKGFQLRW